MSIYNILTFCIVHCLVFTSNAQEMHKNITVVLPGDKKIEFVLIHPGTFDMGSPTDELERHGDEDPVRKIVISKGYYLGKYEVTQEQWLAVMGDNPSIFTDKEIGGIIRWIMYRGTIVCHLLIA